MILLYIFIESKQNNNKKQNQRKTRTNKKGAFYILLKNKDQFIVSFTIGNYGGIEIASSFSVSGNNLPERGVRLLYVKNQYGTWTLYGTNVNKSQSLDVKKTMHRSNWPTTCYTLWSIPRIKVKCNDSSQYSFFLRYCKVFLVLEVSQQSVNNNVFR